MNPPQRRVATPSLSLKRKETTDHFRPSLVLTKSLKPPPQRNGSAQTTRPCLNPANTSKPASSSQAVTNSNNLTLAGYMAHEFLSKGTILGEKIDPNVPPEPSRISSRSSEPSRQADERYVEVCNLLKTDGSHIPGIVNPKQLARYLNR